MITCLDVKPNDDPDDETDACPIHGRQELMNSRHLSEVVRAAWIPSLRISSTLFSHVIPHLVNLQLGALLYIPPCVGGEP